MQIRKNTIRRMKSLIARYKLMGNSEREIKELEDGLKTDVREQPEHYGRPKGIKHE